MLVYLYIYIYIVSLTSISPAHLGVLPRTAHQRGDGGVDNAIRAWQRGGEAPTTVGPKRAGGEEAGWTECQPVREAQSTCVVLCCVVSVNVVYHVYIS